MSWGSSAAALWCVLHSSDQVLVRARIHNTRGKGKSAFLVLRQRTATVQVRASGVHTDST